jgi:hypothetical protein
MSELKTLKDLKEENEQKINQITENLKKGIFPTEQDIDYSSNQISYDRLRQEAVKWVKELSKPKGTIRFGNKMFSWDKPDKIHWYGDAYREVARAVIMHLNNITEEDLK